MHLQTFRKPSCVCCNTFGLNNIFCQLCVCYFSCLVMELISLVPLVFLLYSLASTFLEIHFSPFRCLVCCFPILSVFAFMLHMLYSTLLGEIKVDLCNECSVWQVPNWLTWRNALFWLLFYFTLECGIRNIHDNWRVAEVKFCQSLSFICCWFIR